MKKHDILTELLTGIIVVFLIITILLSFVYYFLVFAPQQEEFNNLKQEKINKVHSLLSKDENHNKASYYLRYLHR